MSLDVCLTSHEEMACPHCSGTGRAEPEALLFEANITHNLNRMAVEAGIYEAVWRPDEHGFETAGQVAEVLRPGLDRLKAEPELFQGFSAPNGWGTYDQFIPWLEKYLEACEAYPEAKIRVSR